MQTLFQAGCVTVEESDQILTVGFADRKFDTSQYFIMQRGMAPDNDDGVYLEHLSQAYCIYGTVTSCLLSSQRVEFSVDARTAADLRTEATFAIELSSDPPLLRQLATGLERMFAGTSCRLEISTAGSSTAS